jgi:CheY-like chemotaxis protein/HPt (histidine-containing phosphotransfer) domain-containing protein
MSRAILVVEDQEPIRELIRAILASAGYEVAVAANGAEAVAAVRDTGFALVLMDVHMPVMDGLAATQKIRALEGPHSTVPIVAISDDMPSLRAAGMNDHISKPFRKAELLRKIDTWLNRSGGSTPAAAQQKKGGTAFEEACELMGRPWAIRGLNRLAAQIDEAFGSQPGTDRANERLVGQAHALVSLAALLGFATLSKLCSTLEDAGKSGHDVKVPFEQAKAAALEARAAALGLIADLEARHTGTAG